MNKLKDLINDSLMISQRQFEKKTGISRQTIYNIMHDKGTPSVLTVKKICAFFGVDYKDYI
ncbi:MAG: helix-turn-helix domain-containing protein [Candidatus Coproplasma sp.]